MINYVKKLFGLKYNEPVEPYIQTMNSFFILSNWEHYRTIVDVKVARHKQVILINVITVRPGLLIGKAGRFIQALGKEISKKHGAESTSIFIEEPKIWLKFK